MDSVLPLVKNKGLHPRNVHNVGYNFPELIMRSPDLEQYVRPNPFGALSIDFSNPMAVKALNLALLKQFYNIDYWDIPEGFLCPPIPGRVDYIHHIADLLSIEDKSPKGRRVKVLDIGTGANAIYPLLGIQTYGWQFVASDIDRLATDNVEEIIKNNPGLTGMLEVRLQDKPENIFQNIILPNDRFNVTLCNPPFHASLAEANAGSQRKINNLAVNRSKKNIANVTQDNESSQVALNFGGQKAELWCEGGERQFLQRMIKESKSFSQQCQWFTSLISKKDNLPACQKALKDAKAQQVKVIEMKQGNKQTRILCWSFLNEKQARLWLDFHS